MKSLAVGAAGIVLAAMVAPPAFASSHREAPLTAGDPQIDNTDVYAFVSPDNADTVTLVSNWIPFEEPTGGPNFYPWAEATHYDINIDNNGDAKPDITYRWTFTSAYKSADTFLYNTGPVNDLKDPTLNFTQTYTLERIAGDKTDKLVDNAPVAPSNVGAASMPDYGHLRDQAIATFADGKSKSFAGQADDPFFLDLRVFDLLYGGNLKEAGKNTLAGYNVNSVALQIPKTDLAAGGDVGTNPIVGVWSTTSRQTMAVQGADGTKKFSGDFVQVSRLGSPLVNEVVVPVGKKDAFNASKPEADAQFLPKVQDPELPHLIEKIYKMPAPATPRNDLVQVFLTGVDGLTKPANVTPAEELRLNMSIAPTASPNRLGVIGGDKQGYPNGRRLADDVVDIDLRVLEGELLGNKNTLGDGVDSNDLAFGKAFPYLALPHSGSATRATLSTGGGSGSGASGSSASASTAGGRSAPRGGVATGGGGTAPREGGLPLLPMSIAAAGIAIAGAGLAASRRTKVRA